jgi:uncharacterized protein (TIGR03083 family)
MSEADQLQQYIDLWRVIVAENVALLRALDADDWAKPTDLPGWNVRYIAAHLAHLESDLAGNPQTPVDVPEAPHIKGPMNVFTESGPLARADWTIDEIIDEIESSAATRDGLLRAMMPLDPTAPGDGLAALAGWDWATLPDDPTVRIGMDFETFIVLSGGRRTPEQVTAAVSGDAELGKNVLANLAVTP